MFLLFSLSLLFVNFYTPLYVLSIFCPPVLGFSCYNLFSVNVLITVCTIATTSTQRATSFVYSYSPRVSFSSSRTGVII